MEWSLVPAWLALAAAAFCAELSPELVTLVRIKTAMSQTLARQPNYTCIQQIERSHRKLPRRRFELRDVLRVEVALVDGKEMFAWPGARNFERTDLTEMVADGAIGTGDFALHARSIFQSSAPTFKHAGMGQVRGHSATRYDYLVPLLSSGYRIKSHGREAIVAYHGSFWADSATHELLRLEVNADDIPPELGVASVQDVMDYEHMMIAGSEFLLPVESDLAMTDLSGNQSRNRTQFKSCRQYTGESVLTFGEAPEAGGQADGEDSRIAEAKAKSTVEIPAGIALDIRLISEIDSESSAVGDRVTATLDQNLRTQRRVLFAKGSTLIGRILRLERHPDYAIIDLQFSEIESDDTRANIKASAEEMIVPLTAAAMRPVFNASENLVRGSGIQIQGGRIHLRRGSRFRLRTAAGFAVN